MQKSRVLITWIIALTVIAGVFYAIDRSIMASQGLPLNWLLQPAQS
ncbi:MAG: hypothetical protein ACE5FO_10325 [Parvularculaceae bacterium]